MAEYLTPLLDVITNVPLFIILNIFFIIAVITDIKFMKIYDKFNIVMLVVRIITFFIFGFSFSYVVGGILMFVSLLIGAMITNAKIGGDIKFSGNLGLFVGFIPSVLIMFTAILINFIYRKITKNTKAIALAPFLYVGFLIVSILTYVFVWFFK